MRPSRLLTAALLAAAPCASALRIEKIPLRARAGIAGSAAAQGYESVVAEEAVVWFDASVSTALRSVRAKSVGGAVLQEQPDLGWTHISLAPSMSVADALAILRGLPGVLRAEPNRAYSVSRTPSDPLFSSQYHFEKISAAAGWEFETGGSSRATVAVIDTGIEGTHPDLQAKLAGLTHKNCLDNCADEAAGGAAVAACEHGTEVAGFAAAATDNGTMVSGVSWGARLLSMRVFGTADCTADCGDIAADSCTTSDTRVSNALQYLITQQNTAAHGRIVANLSLGCLGGGLGCQDCDAVIQPAITAALNAGIVVVAAAGNSGPADNTVNRPGSCAGVIPVTATDAADALASFSSRGPEVAANGLAAPGSSLMGTTIGATTKSGLNGTSFSAPIVAGAAALILSRKPTAAVTAASNEVKNILRGTANNIGLAANLQGAGRLDLYRALRYTARGTLAGFDGEEKPIAFPNPFRPSQSGTVGFAIPPALQGAATKIKIYTLDGAFVREVTGTSWNGRNAEGRPVASGTYVFVVTTSAGTGRGRLSVLR
ncbi:MAG: S8 family serine peptidase [Elusimicrobia bacterium]|nr:S8 family serine peptidase [Elusimicrobiota bacterium]